MGTDFMTLIDNENVKIVNEIIDNLLKGHETCSSIFNINLYDKNNTCVEFEVNIIKK